MVDITKMVAPKTDQLNADDFIGKAPVTIRISGAKDTGNKEQPLALSYEGDNGKPWKPGLAMRRVLIQIWGDEVCAEAEKHFPSRAVTLYRDPDVKFGGVTVGGVRVSHATNITKETKCTMTISKGKRVEFIVKPLKIEAAAPAIAPLIGPEFVMLQTDIRECTTTEELQAAFEKVNIARRRMTMEQLNTLTLEKDKKKEAFEDGQ